MPEMRVMDPAAGDLKVIWDKSKPDEVKAAREQFDELKKKKYIAYRVDDEGEKAEIMKEFDPKAEKVILALPVVGG